MQFWREWYDRVSRSRSKPLKCLARRLVAKIDGVSAPCWRTGHASLLVGISNKIKVIKGMASGFRDDAWKISCNSSPLWGEG